MSRTCLLASFVVALSGGPAAQSGEPKQPDAHRAAFQKIHDQIRALQEACDKAPKAWEPRLRLAEFVMRFGLRSLALKRLDEAIRLKPDHAPLYELAGRARFDLAEYDAAIELWQKALKLIPGNEKLQSWIAQAKEAREDDAELVKLDARLKKRPADTDALLARARIRFKREDWKAALADLAPYLEARPGAAEALGMAAMASFRLDQLSEAIGLWERAARADPENQEYSLRLRQARQLKETHDSLALVRQQLAKTPDDGKLRIQAGELWARLGRYDHAALNLEHAVRRMPRDPMAHRLYGLALMRLNRMNEAVTALETCVALDPKDEGNKKLLESVRQTFRMHESMRKMKGHGGGVPQHGMPPGHVPIAPSPGTPLEKGSEK